MKASLNRFSIILALALGTTSPGMAQDVFIKPLQEEPAEIAREDMAFLESARGIEIEIVESAPIETELDQEDIRNASDVWIEMINGAERSLDIAEMYLSSHEDSSLLDPVIDAVVAAAERNVRVRLLAEKSFYGTYPETIDRFKEVEGIDVRFFDIKPMTGGVLHAKYFIVDGKEIFLGSQNFDWRALEHIHEIGLRVMSEPLASTLGRIFDSDWALSGEDSTSQENPPTDSGDKSTASSPASEAAAWWDATTGDSLRAYLVASPPGINPPGIPAAENELVRLIHSAKEEILVQLLSYSPTDRERVFYPEIDNAIRDAESRGVKVYMILSDWNKRRPGIDYLKSLTLLPNVTVRLSTIPEWSGGFIPYARVEHCKYMVVDRATLWVGTSNWSKDYFHNSRNVEMVVESTKLAERMKDLFYFSWYGPYTYPLRVDVDYVPPKTH